MWLKLALWLAEAVEEVASIDIPDLCPASILPTLVLSSQSSSLKPWPRNRLLLFFPLSPDFATYLLFCQHSQTHNCQLIVYYQVNKN